MSTMIEKESSDIIKESSAIKKDASTENKLSGKYHVIGDELLIKHSAPPSNDKEGIAKSEFMDALINNVQVYNENVDKFIESQTKHLQNIESGHYDRAFEQNGHTQEGLHPKDAVQKYLGNQLKELDKHRQAIVSHCNKQFGSEQPSLNVELYKLPKETIKSIKNSLESTPSNISDFLSKNKYEPKSLDNKDILKEVLKDTPQTLVIKEASKDTATKDTATKNIPDNEASKDMNSKAAPTKEASMAIAEKELPVKESVKESNSKAYAVEELSKETTSKTSGVTETAKDITFSYKIIGDQLILKYSDDSPKGQALEDLFKKIETYNKKVEQFDQFKKQHESNIKSKNYDKLFDTKGLSAEGLHPQEVAQKTFETEKENLIKEGKEITETLEKKLDKSDVSIKGEAYTVTPQILQDLKKHLEKGGALEQFLAEKQIEPIKLENRQAVMDVVNTTTRKESTNDKTPPDMKVQDSFKIDNNSDKRNELKKPDNNPDKADELKKPENNPDKAKESSPKDPNKNPELADSYRLRSNSDEIRKDISESHEAVKGVYGFENYFFNKTETITINESSTKDISSRKGEPSVAQTKTSTISINKNEDLNKAAQKASYNTKADGIRHYDLLVQDIKNNYSSLPLSERRKMKEQSISEAISKGIPITRPSRVNAMSAPAKDALTKARLDIQKH